MSERCKKLNGTAQDDALEFSADAMSLSPDHAIPPGLLINELVTNAVKYAYPGSHGVIKVSAYEIDDQRQRAKRRMLPDGPANPTQGLISLA
jgi:two-component sensor histidine kinase